MVALILENLGFRKAEQLDLVLHWLVLDRLLYVFETALDLSSQRCLLFFIHSLHFIQLFGDCL